MISLAIFGLPCFACLVLCGTVAVAPPPPPQRLRRAVLASLIRFDLVWGVELKPELLGSSWEEHLARPMSCITKNMAIKNFSSSSSPWLNVWIPPNLQYIWLLELLVVTALLLEKLKLRGGSSSNRSLSADDIGTATADIHRLNQLLGVMVPARSARRNHQLTAIYLGN